MEKKNKHYLECKTLNRYCLEWKTDTRMENSKQILSKIENRIGHYVGQKIVTECILAISMLIILQYTYH